MGWLREGRVEPQGNENKEKLGILYNEIPKESLCSRLPPYPVFILQLLGHKFHESWELNVLFELCFPAQHLEHGSYSISNCQMKE